MLSLILTIIGIAIFAAYVFTLFGVNKKHYGTAFPSSLSNSFYLYNGIKPNLGYVFTGMMFSIAIILMMGWIDLNESFEDWRRYLSVIPFLTCGAIAFVGAAPAFRSSKMESLVHETSATVAAALAILWTILQNSSATDWWLIPVSFGIGVLVPVIVGCSTKTMKSAVTFHIEMMAFILVFVSAFAHCLMNVLG